MKPKINRKGQKNKSIKYDRCQTPFYGVDPLIPYLPKNKVIWESACGNGNIVKKLKSEGYNVIGNDILQNSDFDFFAYQPDNWDIQVTNPPYSTKYDWLERSYQLGKPFALLLPLETWGTAKGQNLFKQFGVQVILLDKRINFYMPDKGYSGGGAQFPTAWFTWGLKLPDTVVYETVTRYEDNQIKMEGLNK